MKTEQEIEDELKTVMQQSIEEGADRMLLGAIQALRWVSDDTGTMQSVSSMSKGVSF